MAGFRRTALADPAPAAMVQAGGGALAPVDGGAGQAGMQVSAQGAGALAVMTQARAEIEAAILVAKRFPRDERASTARIQAMCGRPGLAENALYRFKRGKGMVEGPSVDIARPMAAAWGNVRYGCHVISSDEERIHLRGFAYDMEANVLVETEASFARLVQRKRWSANGESSTTEWVTPDERDARELTNKHGAILERNAILKLLPTDVVEDAIARCRETMSMAAASDLTEDKREGTLKKIAGAFARFGVDQAALERKLDHSLRQITPEELAELRRLHNAIQGGQAKAEEVFAPEQAEQAASVDVGAMLGAATASESPTPQSSAGPTGNGTQVPHTDPKRPPAAAPEPAPKAEPQGAPPGPAAPRNLEEARALKAANMAKAKAALASATAAAPAPPKPIQKAAPPARTATAQELEAYRDLHRIGFEEAYGTSAVIDGLTEEQAWQSLISRGNRTEVESRLQTMMRMTDQRTVQEEAAK